MQGPGAVLNDPRLAEAARELAASGQPFALATVVYRRPPVSAQVGDKALVSADGRLIGWIGGSCSQPVVRREAAAAIQSGRPRLLRLTTGELGLAGQGEGLSTVPMTCPSGGEVEIYIEPYVLRPRLVAVGNTPLVRALGQLAPVLGFEISLVADEGEEPAFARTLTLEDLKQADLGEGSFVVVASAGHYDEAALLAALRTPAPYIALVASHRRALAVREVLAASGCSEADLARIRTPAGLAIGAVTQEEIALSVLAEIVSEYRRRQQQLAAVPPPAPLLARDPVCGMAVEVAGARFTAEHAGTTYYFCCPHCRHHFLKDPTRYLAAQPAPDEAQPAPDEAQPAPDQAQPAPDGAQR